MKTEKQIMAELHDELVKQLVEKQLQIDIFHLWEPLKKATELCKELEYIRDRISLLEKRMK